MTELANLYVAIWTADAFDANAETVTISFFNAGRCYSDKDYDAIKALEIGCRWISADYGMAHQVIRIR